MRIGTKLYCGFGLIVLLIVVVALFLLQMFDGLNQNTMQMVNQRYEKVRQISAFRYELNHWSRELRSLPVQADQAALTEQLNIAEASRLTALVALDAIDKSAADEEDRLRMVKIKSIVFNYDQLGEAVVRTATAGGSPEQVQPVLFEAAQVRSDIIRELDQMQNEEEAAIKQEMEHLQTIYRNAVNIIYAYIVVGVLLAVGITYWVIEGITGNLNKVTTVLSNAVNNNLDYLPRLHVSTKDEVGEIAAAFNKMADVLDTHAELEQEQNWLNLNIADIATMCQGKVDFKSLAQAFLPKIATIVGASYGVFYLKQQRNGEQYLLKLSAYAGAESGERCFKFGDGLAGQCALSRKLMVINEVPDDYMKITSGLGQAPPRSIILLPIEFENQLWGVLELASFSPLGRLEQKLLLEAVNSVGITLSIIHSRVQVENLLEESQALAQELQEQSEELQTQQEELNAQQEELIAINEQLEQQYSQSEIKSRELEKAKATLEKHAKQLTQSSKYKSEFLANMSHELRTPLNSLLILAQILAENKVGNLTERQVEYANTICSSGHDLLNLINDILDLSKIESGRMEVNLSEVKPQEVCLHLTNQFKLMAGRKGIEFTTKINPGTPAVMHTDEQRLRQVLKNLLSNAFKFTDTGSVTLEFSKAPANVTVSARDDLAVEHIIAIAVQDTGIGIPDDKQDIIFKAFRQADGTTSRKYGGTGLGLTISRDIANLLGGYIEVRSVLGQGSTFILYVPSYVQSSAVEAVQQASATLSAGYLPATVEGNSDQELLAGKKILIVDDDMRNLFALTSALESQQMKVLIAENGKEGIAVLQQHSDVDLILMDVMMPEMDGFTAMRQIRQFPEFKDLPVIALTAKAMTTDREQCLQAGASDYISKPVNLDQLISLMRVWLYAR